MLVAGLRPLRVDVRVQPDTTPERAVLDLHLLVDDPLHALAPPLAGSPRVTGQREAMIHVLLKGLASVDANSMQTHPYA